MEKLSALCGKRGLTVTSLLAATGISRNALYSLARKESILPRSITTLAGELGVSPTAFLVETESPDTRAARLRGRVNEVRAEAPIHEPENVLHTLLLLEESPVNRLRRALRRGRGLRTV